MSYTYQQRKRPRGQTETTAERATAPGPDLTARIPGRFRPDAAQTGQATDLASVMQARMTSTFGDLSAVRDYRPPARTEAPAPAGPYTGPVTHTLSNAAPSPAAAGPMQASRNWFGGGKKKEEPKKEKPKKEAAKKVPAPDPDRGPLKTNDAAINAAAAKQVDDPMGMGNDVFSQFTTDRSDAMNVNKLQYRPGMQDKMKELIKKYQGKDYKNGAWMKDLSRPQTEGEEEGVDIEGLVPDRILPHLMGDRGRGFSMSGEEVEGLMDKLMAPHKNDLSDEERENANKQFDEGVRQYKGILMDDMNAMESTYGALPGQMHPHDVIPQMGPDYHKKYLSAQDALQMVKSGGKYFDFEHNAEDKKFRDLTHFYVDADNQMTTYATYATQSSLGWDGDPAEQLVKNGTDMKENKAVENSIRGPKMNADQQKSYKSRLKKRAKKGGWKDWLFGRYK